MCNINITDTSNKIDFILFNLIMSDCENSFTVQDLQRKLQKDYRLDISPSTIKNTIKQMSSRGLIEENLRSFSVCKSH